jgi:NADPH:quinone reductase-like Zn-dependent oxidoreductase
MCCEAMKAVTYTRYGPPEVLQISAVAKPTPKPNEILIRVRAAEATKSDCELRSFNYAVKWFWLPLRLALGVRRPRRRVLGCYFAGEIESAGSAVEGLAPGDPVFGSTLIRAGSYAEYLVVPARFPLARKPRTMTFAEAAALPLGGLNALHFMRLANVGQDEQVLVNGAGGSIGSYAVQIAKAMGAHVTAVDRGDKESGVRALGADDFIDYTARDFTRDKGLYDVVFDMVPDSSYSGCIGVLKPDGRYLCGNPMLLSMLRCTLTNR